MLQYFISVFVECKFSGDNTMSVSLHPSIPSRSLGTDSQINICSKNKCTKAILLQTCILWFDSNNIYCILRFIVLKNSCIDIKFKLLCISVSFISHKMIWICLVYFHIQHFPVFRAVNSEVTPMRTVYFACLWLMYKTVFIYKVSFLLYPCLWLSPLG